MGGHSHMLEIYDPDDYHGPNPVAVTGVCTVRGPESRQYYVVEPGSALEVDGRTVRQLALAPHYGGDSIDKVTGGVCTVGIALPRDGQNFENGKTYGFNDFCSWKVGKIHPTNGGD